MSLHAASPTRRQQRLWIFDLDDTLHDAGSWVFGQINAAMTSYVMQALAVDRRAADTLRHDYWRRYGATLLGLVRHHGVNASHFLRETHRLPGLEARVRASPRDRAALRQLGGRRVVLTNAPRDYAQRVLGALGLRGLFDEVLCIDDMAMFGQLRPKPDRRLFRRCLARWGVPSYRCVLVEDSLANQKAAHALGIKTAWMQRYTRPKSHKESVGVYQSARPPFVYARIRSLQQLRRLR